MKRSPAMIETISHLVAQQPFFAVYAFDQMQIIETDEVPTAATDGLRILVNPDFFADMQLSERVFVMAHEILHGIYQHMARGKGYADRGFGPDLKPWNHTKYNQAADYIINDALTNAHVGNMPSKGGQAIGLHDCTIATDQDLADDVYQKLPDPPPNPNGGHGNFDQHIDPPPGQQMPSDADVKRALASAKNAAKAQGKMPGNLERLVGEIIEPTLNWKELLRSLLTANAGKDTATWNRPNRRRIATPPHIYFPGSTGFATGGTAVVIDTSGSVSQTELNAFMSELSGILDECRPEWCKVLWTDAQVAHVDEVDDMTDLASLKPHGGGGTRMPAAFEYMDEHGIRPDTCVVLTDGYTPWGSEPDYDVIWGITTKDKEAPFGKSLHIDAR